MPRPRAGERQPLRSGRRREAAGRLRGPAARRPGRRGAPLPRSFPSSAAHGHTPCRFGRTASGGPGNVSASSRAARRQRARRAPSPAHISGGLRRRGASRGAASPASRRRTRPPPRSRRPCHASRHLPRAAEVAQTADAERLLEEARRRSPQATPRGPSRCSAPCSRARTARRRPRPRSARRRAGAERPARPRPGGVRGLPARASGRRGAARVRQRSRRLSTARAEPVPQLREARPAPDRRAQLRRSFATYTRR